MTKSIAFIHARGGSKRIPRKNIKRFHGKPLIAYPIETALNSGVFDKVIVSTDDQEIADIAVQYGATVPQLRPDHLANDTATTDEVFIHDIQTELKKDSFDYACCIYGTSAFLKSCYLREAHEILQDNSEACSVISVTEYDFSIYRALVKDENNYLQMREPEYRLTRSQDLQNAYHDAAQFYFVPVESYLKEGRVYPKTGMMCVEIPHSEVVDIDTPDDWRRAEIIYQSLHGESHD